MVWSGFINWIRPKSEVPDQAKFVCKTIQESKGTMADKLMYIFNNVTEKHPFCRLELVVKTFKHSSC